MDEQIFNAMADRMLAHIEQVLETCEADIDFETKAGGVIEIDFDNGSKVILNRHSAAREIWIAAKSGGYHFRPLSDDSENANWVNTRDGEPLMAALSRCITEQSGTAVSLD